MSKFVKKPEIVVVVEWTGRNQDEVKKFTNRPITEKDGYLLIAGVSRAAVIGDIIVKNKEELSIVPKYEFEENYSSFVDGLVLHE